MPEQTEYGDWRQSGCTGRIVADSDLNTEDGIPLRIQWRLAQRGAATHAICLDCDTVISHIGRNLLFTHWPHWSTEKTGWMHREGTGHRRVYAVTMDLERLPGPIGDGGERLRQWQARQVAGDDDVLYARLLWGEEPPAALPG